MSPPCTEYNTDSIKFTLLDVSSPRDNIQPSPFNESEVLRSFLYLMSLREALTNILKFSTALMILIGPSNGQCKAIHPNMNLVLHSAA